ncbi:MAG: iron transporter [Streptomycetales bacterium]
MCSRIRNRAATALAVTLALVTTACSDDGAGTRSQNVSAHGPGSGSGSGTGGGSYAASMGSHPVPEGVAHQYALVEEEIEHAGGETRVGPWRIGYIVEAAEPWYRHEKGGQGFRSPAKGETHHIEILPIEAATGRIVPDVPVRVEVVDASGEVVDAKQLNFYYSEFFHYANNFSVPEPGTFTLRATLEPPTFLRHGEHGQTPPLTRGARASFTGVELQPQ